MSRTNNTKSSKDKSKAVKSGKKNTSKKNIKKNASDKNSTAAKKAKKKINLLKLCSVMNNYADDANDKEIIKRFKTTITSSVSEDISKTSLMNILKKPEEISTNDFSESIQPYIKHYLFMVNRSLNKKYIKN
ncbi:MAG: hypothetical protein JXN64_10300 [Spirochaetes bacterium]|nr:hypothetical protein [Spirochaetota bacterium]